MKSLNDEFAYLAARIKRRVILVRSQGNWILPESILGLFQRIHELKPLIYYLDKIEELGRTLRKAILLYHQSDAWWEHYSMKLIY